MIKEVIVSAVSGLVAGIIVLIVSMNQTSKQDGKFEGQTSAEIQAINSQLEKLSKKVDNLYDESNGFREKTNVMSAELQEKSEELKIDLQNIFLELKDNFDDHSKKKLQDFNSINIPKRVVLSNETLQEGQKIFLFSNQLLLLIDSIESYNKLASITLVFPDKTQKTFTGLEKNSREHFNFLEHQYLLDVNFVHVFESDDRSIKNISISITRSVL